MFKKLFTTFSIVSMTLILVPACAEQNADAETVKSTTQIEETSNASTEAEAAETSGEQVSVMDLPVDFSSPEKVEESIEKVREQAGDDAARELSNALGYVLAYDLSVGANKEKMYKKLNGRTPNAIISKMKR
ncbi:MAG: hypothetical protein QNK19_03230 [Xanthomonadales bacterium]|nr:hypothetical protein [Xanthomonadales bacterium]